MNWPPERIASFFEYASANALIDDFEDWEDLQEYPKSTVVQRDSQRPQIVLLQVQVNNLIDLLEETQLFVAENNLQDAYLDWLEGIFQEVYRVTKPGGFCAIVIGTILLEGKHYPVPFDLVSRLSNKNWLFHQDIIWHKCTAGVKRAGVTIQKPFPGYYYPNIMNEYILVFRKPGQKIYQDRSPEEKSRAAYMIDSLFTLETANNIWHIAPVPPSTIDHPAPFPEEIPYRLISLYSYPEEIIL